MKKADLHCHSTFSEHPTEWFLQKLGAKESYTDPLFIYEEAKRQGMDYVSITDHNKIDGALILKEKHPTDVIVGVESTAYFPEDKCKIHILIYGLDDLHFEVINHIRTDIYELRDYLKQENLTHSVAHASYSVNGKLQTHHLEKLILLFDHFEIINGGRNKRSNLGWKHFLDHLDEQKLEDMYLKHRIEPMSNNSWIKGYTGGSDDHGALFLGKTFTQCRADNMDAFLSGIRNKKSSAVGRHNSFHALAFTVYKIAYDFSKQGSGKRNKASILGSITENFFDNKALDIKNRFKLKTLHNVADWQGDRLKLCLGDLVNLLQENRKLHIEEKLDAVYAQISNITDEFFKILLNSLEEDLKDLNLVKIIRNISSSLPGIFLILPFFSSLKHMHQTLGLITDLQTQYHIKRDQQKRRTLWFTDTINDLNGVSVTLKQMGQIAYEKGRELKIVSSLSDHEITDEIPENFLNLPFMYVFHLPFYENYRIKVPSILSCLKLINDFEPDQIIISTPGPIGLLAMLAAKMMQIPAIGIYHTDFVSEVSHIIADESGARLVLEYEKWFYNQMDEIRTPTREYMRILLERDIQAEKMGLLRRGIEIHKFCPFKDRKEFLRTKHSYKEGITLLYAGRVSKDKSLELLVNTYKELCQTHSALNLIIAGNGPYLTEMKSLLADYERVIFTGAIPRHLLPNLYNAADYFVFTSVTDTYGMVILEAQSCGLPAIVSAQGGPKEIILPERSGFIVPDQSQSSWVSAISRALEIYETHPDYYQQLRQESRNRVVDCADWDAILDDILGEDNC